MPSRKTAPAHIALGVEALFLGAALSLAACNSTHTTTNDTSLFPAAYQRQTPTFRPGGPTGSTVSVDLRPYLASVIAQNANTGNMLCEAYPKGDHCVTSLSDTAGEVRIFYSPLTNHIVDYIAIGSHDFPSVDGSSTKRIGVVRNHEGGGSGDQLRCFTVTATSTDHCQSPATKALGPPYLIPYLPVVSEDVLNGASNSDGSPSEPVPGSLLVTPKASTGNYWGFGIQNMTFPGCVQSYFGGTQSRDHVVYVTGVHFGGTVGKQDAIVIDGDSGHTSNMDHIERTFYVQGLGRVREGIAFYSTHDQIYDNMPHYNELHSNERTLNPNIFNIYPAQCPQGSAVTLFPSALKLR